MLRTNVRLNTLYPALLLLDAKKRKISWNRHAARDDPVPFIQPRLHNLPTLLEVALCILRSRLDELLGPGGVLRRGRHVDARKLAVGVYAPKCCRLRGPPEGR